MATEKPLVVIVGSTASGKTGLAIKIAKQFDGEIISADSRAIYRGMDIGTAKPTLAEQDGVIHWGIDLVNPDERFTVADFQKYAKEKIIDIRSRGKLPIMVGGSGLYVDSVVFDYNFTTDYDVQQRLILNEMSTKQLTVYCKKHNIKLPENNCNKRYIVRTIERRGKNDNNRDKIIGNCIVVGIATNKNELMLRIRQRAKTMFESDIVTETKRLAEQYPFTIESMKSNIYPIVWRMINGEIVRDEAIELYITDDWHLARKQNTWFKRNKYIKWMPRIDLEKYLAQKL